MALYIFSFRIKQSATQEYKFLIADANSLDEAINRINNTPFLTNDGAEGYENCQVLILNQSVFSIISTMENKWYSTEKQKEFVNIPEVVSEKD